MHKFQFAIHLFCLIHARDNVKKNLRDCRFPESVVNEIADDVFGKQVGSTYCEGLVDAESKEVFYQKLEEKRLLWEKTEKEHPGCSSGFYDWFCQHQYEPIVSGMLRHVREDAGLGVPPSPFTTNASESLNAVLKRKVNYKKNELPEFVMHLKELIDEQQWELEHAIIGQGKYVFKDEYKHLETQVTKQQREKHIQKIANAKLMCERWSRRS